MADETLLLDSMLQLSERIRILEEKLGERFWGNDVIPPAYAAPIGTAHWDSNLQQLWGNFDGTALGWQLVGGGGVAAHNLLNNVVHPDTALQAVSRGSLVYGDATPLWNELVHPGATDRLLRSDANDVSWHSAVLTIPAAGGITFAAGSGINILTVPDNLADALSIEDAGALEYLRVVSSNAAPKIIFVPAGTGASVSAPGTGTASERFGDLATCAGDRTVAIGYGANASDVRADDCVVIGYLATTTLDRNVVIGRSAVTTSQNSISIGYNASNVAGSVSIGTSISGQNNDIGIGNSVVSRNEDVVIGSGAQDLAPGIQAVCIGRISRSNNLSVSVGYAALSTTYCIAIGGSAQANTNQDAITIGRSSRASGIRSLSIGNLAISTAADSACIAYNTTNAQANSIVIGGIASGSNWMDIASGTLTAGAKLHLVKESTDTNAIRDLIIATHNSSNVPVNGFGGAFVGKLDSSTTAEQEAIRWNWAWSNATHANRSAELITYLYSNAVQLEFSRFNGVNTQPYISFNEQEADIDFFVSTAIGAQTFFIQSSDGYASFNERLVVGGTIPGVAAPAQFNARQDNNAAAIACVYMVQEDVSEEFIRFQGSAAAATLTQSIVAEADVTTATRQGWLKVYVVDDGNQITDQAYFVPIYTLA